MVQHTHETDVPIKATERSFQIVEEIRQRDGAGVTELATHFGVSKSTIHEHLTTLTEMNYLCRDGNEYHVGLRFLSLGGYSRRQQELYKLARPEIDDLAEETGESAKVVVEEHGRGVYLYQARGERAVQTDAHDGTRVHLHSTGVGKAILSHLPAERVDRIIEQWGLPGRTEETITDQNELHAELAQIREREYAVDNEERIRGLRCVAVPVMRGDEVMGGISVSGPTKRFDQNEFIEELAGLLQNTARVIEINAKYTR